jgi:hypothetical protein
MNVTKFEQVVKKSPNFPKEHCFFNVPDLPSFGKLILIYPVNKDCGEH